MRGMTGATDLRGLDGLAVLRDDAQRVFHRRLLGLFERTIDRIRGANEETASKGASEIFVVSIQQVLTLGHATVLRLRGKAGGIDLAQDHMVAGIAGNA